jgi:hypothetical protein
VSLEGKRVGGEYFEKKKVTSGRIEAFGRGGFWGLIFFLT